MSAPTAAPATIAMSVAATSGTPPCTLMYQATTAPMVTSSPCAKLVSPVVPKISDSPTAQTAMIRPKRRPSTSSWIARMPPPPAFRVPSLRPRFTGWARPLSTVTVRLSSPLSTTPSGRASPSMETTYWPGPGRSTCHRPSPSVSHGVDLVAVDGGHGDRDALDRPGLAGLQRAAHRLALGLGDARGEQRGQGHGDGRDEQGEHERTRVPPRRRSATTTCGVLTGRPAGPGAPSGHRARGHGGVRASLDLLGRSVVRSIRAAPGVAQGTPGGCEAIGSGQ